VVLKNRLLMWAACGVMLCSATALAQFSETITGFETNREGEPLAAQPVSFGDLYVVMFQDPREADVTADNILPDTSETPLPSSEESFVADFTGDGFYGAGGSQQSLDIRFQWKNPDDANRWVLVETFQSPLLGDPSLHLNGVVSLKFNFPYYTDEFPELIYTQKVGVALLIRETGKRIPQGFRDSYPGALEFVGVTSVADADTAYPIPVPATYINAPTMSGDNGWVSLTFDLDALQAAGQVIGWTAEGGDGVLDATGAGDGVNRGVLAGLVITVDPTDTTSQYVEVMLDDIVFDAPVVDPTYPPAISTPVIAMDTSVRVKNVLSSATQVRLEIDRSDEDNEDPFTADETYYLNPAGALYVDFTVPTLAVGDRLRASQTNPSGTSGYSLEVRVNPPAAFTLTLSLDEDGNFGAAPADFEFVGAASAINGAPQGKPIFRRNGVWQNVEFSLIPGAEPVIDFAGGNGQLEPDGGLYNIDALFMSIDVTDPQAGPHDVFIDHIYVIDADDNEILINDAEAINPFPSFRGQSTPTVSQSSIISGIACFDGQRSNRIQWEWVNNNTDNTIGVYRPRVAFADSAKAVGLWLLVEDPRTSSLPLPVVGKPIVGNAPAVEVSNIDPTATQVTLLVNGNVAGSVAGGSETVSIVPGVALQLGDSVSARYTTSASETSDMAYPVVVSVPAKPTVQGPLVQGMTSVEVTGILNSANAMATLVTLYEGDNVIGTKDPQGADSVVFDNLSPALMFGQEIRATQTVNSATSPKSDPVTVAVPAPVLPGPVSVGDTSVKVDAVHPLATLVTAYVNGTPHSAAAGGVTTVMVPVPLLTVGDTIHATQTISGVEGPASNTLVVVRSLCLVDFADDFDAGTSAAGWTLRSTSNDYTANFAFDYSTRGIPSAPHSVGGSTIGLYFAVNKDATPSLEAVSAFPIGKSFSGDFALKFDMWMNYNGGSGGGAGSTENFTAGVNHSGTQVVWPNNPLSDGFWFTTTGEGGAAADYCAYIGPTLQGADTGYYAAQHDGTYTALNHFNAFYQALFPSPPFETPGAPGKQWVEVEISRINGVTEWRLNGTKIAAHADATYTSGNIMLGYMDLYTSIASPPQDAFVVYDNVRVMVPRPAAAKGDWNGDSVIDLIDYVAFEDCLGGPSLPPQPSQAECGNACLDAFDFDLDGDVDLVDWSYFQEAY